MSALQREEALKAQLQAMRDQQQGMETALREEVSGATGQTSRRSSAGPNLAYRSASRAL